MLRLVRFLACSVLTMSAVVSLPPDCPAQARSASPPRVAQAAVGKPYVVVVKSLEVKTTDSSGNSWDLGGGRPDLQVTVTRREPALEAQVAELVRQRDERSHQVQQEQQRQLEQELDRRGVRHQQQQLREQFQQFKLNLEMQSLTAAETKKLLRERERRLRQEQSQLEKPTRDALRRQQRPDPLLAKLDKEIQYLRKQFSASTPTVDDTYAAVYNMDTIGVAPGDVVKLLVQDIDFAFHDTIGETSLEITPTLLRQGRVDLKFGQVIALKLEFKPR